MNVFTIRFLIFILVISIVLFSVLIYKAYVINKPCTHKLRKLNDANKIKINDDILNRLQNALRYPTISFDHKTQNVSALREYIGYIRKEYAELEAYDFVTLHMINNLSMLYEIRGSETDLKPYMLAAHSDVVPVEGQLDRWTYEPFGAKIDDGYVYARGALDDKSSMLAHLEATSVYLKKYGRPKRSFYLAYGHDEEVAGYNGALSISKFLSNKSIEFIIDEGTMVIEDLVKGLDRPGAFISVADKGYLTVKFSVNTTGGHSSMPSDDNSAIFILTEAINKLKNKKSPSFLGYGPEKDTFEKLAAYLGFSQRLLLSNLWLFKPLVEIIISKSTLDALQRTTTSVTMFHSGVKDNVIPTYAEFVVNHRIYSLQSCEDILNFDLDVIGDKRINYEVISCQEPTRVSPTDSLGYKIIEHATLQTYPEAIPIPSIMIALTDSRFYTNLTQNIYKFLPAQLKMEETKRYHGIDERLSVNNYENMINFFYLLIENSDNAHLDLDFYKNDEF